MHKLAGFGNAHAACVIVKDDGAELHEGGAKNPVIQAEGATHSQEALVTSVAKVDSMAGECESLTGDGEGQFGRVLAAVAALVGAIGGLLDPDAVELVEDSLDLVVGAGDDVGAGVDDGIFDLISVKEDRGPPEGLVGVLVGPGDGTSELGMVDVADIEGGFAIAAKSELEGARLDGVLLLGGPDEGILLDVESTVFGGGEGEAELATSEITVKVFSAMTDGNVVGVDMAYGYVVGVDVAVDMEVDVGEVKGGVEVDGRKRLFRVVEGLVEDEVGRAGIEDDGSSLRGKADVNEAGPIGVVTKRGLAGGTFLFVGVVQVDDVQVLTGGVEVAL